MQRAAKEIPTPAGELRIDLDSPQDPRVEELQDRLGYAYSHRHPKNPADPYQALLATTAKISSAQEFYAEYRRVVRILGRLLPPGWVLKIAYYPAGQSRFRFYTQFDSNHPEKSPLYEH